jgi:hypothetical protein
MMTPAQRTALSELNKRFKAASTKKIDEVININTELLLLLQDIDPGQGSHIQKVIVGLYIQILIRIDYDPHSFKTSLNKKLEYAFESLDKHFIASN